MNKRSYGQGRVFLNGNLWWISYCVNGKECRESSRSTSETEARKLLRRRLTEKDEGKLIIINQHKVKFDDLIELLLLDHQVHGRTETVKYHVKHLRRCFGFDRALAITNHRLLKYVQSRQDDQSSYSWLHCRRRSIWRSKPESSIRTQGRASRK